jgi:hypothetical protein
MSWNTPDRDREEWAAVRRLDGYRDDDYRPTWVEAQRDQNESNTTPTRWAAVPPEPAAQRTNPLPTEPGEAA